MHIVIDARNRRASTGRYTDRLIQHLQIIDTENNYTVLLQPEDDWQPTNSNFTTKPCRFQQFSFNPRDQIAFAWQLYRLRPSLVHFTMTQQPVLYFGNIVTTTHDLTMLHHTRPSRFPAWVHKIGMGLYRFLLWWAHRKSKKIIVPTDYVAKDLAKYQPFTKKKIVRTYESAEPPVNDPAEPLSGVDKPFIFHVGQPLPHKNIERLIKAFEILKTSHHELQLILPGKIKGVFREDLNRWIATSSANDSIIVPGYISDPQLKWMYQNAECYALPSLSEGFGLPGLEAMAHDCPLVSSSATCLPEVYKDAAVYFDPLIVEDMAEKLASVIADKKLAKDLVNKSHDVLKLYSWRTMAQETLQVYNSTIR
jgi:glycosyltransferase involved in cell wall biosynthesis